MYQKCDLWAWRRNEKKGQKLSCVKLAICPDHPRRRRPLKFCMRGHVREVVTYLKFHENRSRGLRYVEGRKSPSPIDLAHGLYNSLYYRTSRDVAALCLYTLSQKWAKFGALYLLVARVNFNNFWQWDAELVLDIICMVFVWCTFVFYMAAAEITWRKCVFFTTDCWWLWKRLLCRVMEFKKPPES